MQRNFKLGLSLQWITLIQFRPCNKLQSGKARPPQSSQWAILSRAALLCSGSADSRLTKATEAKSADFSAIAHVLHLMICAKKKWEGGGNCTFYNFPVPDFGSKFQGDIGWFSKPRLSR